MKTTFIATVFNEKKTIDAFIASILNQTKKPDEIIIVDGGSTDTTFEKLKQYNKIEVLEKKGNRSVGRNEAIKHAKGEIILISDAGNVLEKNWVKYITEPFKNKAVDVVAGYYDAKPKTAFQEALIPYVFVMPDKVDSQNFLPATRSMAIKKFVWKKAGKFDEKLSHNEDYAFAKELQKMNAKIVFQKKAIVYWQPRSNIKQAFWMFYRFAYGDAEANIFRPKVALLFLRYVVVLLLILLIIYQKSLLFMSLLIILFFLYLLWAVLKNSKYMPRLLAKLYLPIIQCVADVAVMSGTLFGAFGIDLFFPHQANEVPTKE